MAVKTFGTITLARVDDGADGIPGKPGTDGKTPYLHTAYSWSADGTDRFTTVYPNLNLLKVSRGPFTPNNNPSNFDNTLYTNAIVYLEKGTTYTISASSNGNFTSDHNPTTESDNIVLWLTNVTLDNTDTKFSTIISSQTTGTTGTTFTWSRPSMSAVIRVNAYHRNPIMHVEKIKIEKGTVATPWMPSASEVTTADWPSYIGQYTDFTQDDSTKPLDYTWSLMRGNDGKDGEDGKPGKDGVGIKSTLIQYASNTSGTVAPTTGWTTTIPAASPGHYVWTKYTWTYTDGTTEAGYSVGKIGETGQTGQKGDTGPRGSTGATGPRGPQGPKGDPGSKDVPVITSGTSFPSTRKTGDMHWMTNSAGVVTGYYKFNGSQWVVQKIDAKSLNVSSLSALSANLGTVTAGTINGVDINGSTLNSPYALVQEDVGSEGHPAYIYHTGSLALSNGKIVADDTVIGPDKTTVTDKIKMVYDPSKGISMQSFDATGKNEQYYMGLSPLGGSIVMRSRSYAGVLDASYLSMVNNCGEILWSGNLFMQSGQIVTPSINLTKCLYGWNLVWQPYDNGVALDYGGVIVTPVYKTIAMSIGKTHAWNYGMYSYLHGNAFLTKYFYVGSKGDTISGNDQNSVGNSRYYVLTKVLAF